MGGQRYSMSQCRGAIDLLHRHFESRALPDLASVWQILRGDYQHRVQLTINGSAPTFDSMPTCDSASRDGADGHSSTTGYSFIVCQNTLNTGKAIPMAPRAKLDDGKLDVLLMWRPLSRWSLMMLFLKLLRGRHVDNPAVQTTAAPRSSTFEYLHIDGELRIEKVAAVGEVVATATDEPLPTTTTESPPAAPEEGHILVDGENIKVMLPVTMRVKQHAFRVFV